MASRLDAYLLYLRWQHACVKQPSLSSQIIHAAGHVRVYRTRAASPHRCLRTPASPLWQPWQTAVPLACWPRRCGCVARVLPCLALINGPMMPMMPAQFDYFTSVTTRGVAAGTACVPPEGTSCGVVTAQPRQAHHQGPSLIVSRPRRHGFYSHIAHLCAQFVQAALAQTPQNIEHTQALLATLATYLVLAGVRWCTHHQLKKHRQHLKPEHIGYIHAGFSPQRKLTAPPFPSCPGC